MWAVRTARRTGGDMLGKVAAGAPRVVGRGGDPGLVRAARRAGDLLPEEEARLAAGDEDGPAGGSYGGDVSRSRIVADLLPAAVLAAAGVLEALLTPGDG